MAQIDFGQTIISGVACSWAHPHRKVVPLRSQGSTSWAININERMPIDWQTRRFFIGPSKKIHIAHRGLRLNYV